MEWHVLSSQKNKISQYVSLKNSSAIFNHIKNLAKILIKLFSPFPCLATVYGKKQ